MITDTIQNAAVYSRLRPGIRKALNYLQQSDFRDIEPGVVTIEGDNIFAIISTYQTREYDPNKWESHQEFIDVQYIIEGEEYIGYSQLNNCLLVEKYKPDNDIAFWKASGDMISLNKNSFAILFPGDAHQPGIQKETPSTVKKVVVKVRIQEIES